MKILKGFLNFFGIVLAVVLSVLLLICLIATPVITSVTNIATPKTVQKILTNIDYEEMLEEVEANSEAKVESLGVSADTIQTFMESNATKETLELYLDDVKAMLSDEDVEKGFTPEAVKAIVDEHIDEICDISYDLVKAENPKITKEELKSEISENSEDVAQVYLEVLPDTKELINLEAMNSDTVNLLKSLTSGSIKLYVYVVILVLSLLIFGCRFVRFKGFMWLAVIYVLGAIFAFITRYTVNSLWQIAFSKILPISPDVMAPAVSVALSQFIVIGIVLLVLAAVFIFAFIYLRKKLKKQIPDFANAPVFNDFTEQAASFEAETEKVDAENNQTV